MKKSLLLLSLFFVAQGAFSNNTTAESRNRIETALVAQGQNDIIPTGFSIDLGDDYTLAVTIVSIDGSTCSYIGTLTHSGVLVGTVTGDYKLNATSVGALLDDSYIETYSNDETAAVIKPRHDTVKAAIGNVR